MGRTNPTYRDLLRGIRERWADFRRALRKQDQPHFDRLFEYGRSHADAGGYLNPEDPRAPLYIAIDLEQEKRLEDLETRVEELETTDSPTEQRTTTTETDADSTPDMED